MYLFIRIYKILVHFTSNLLDLIFQRWLSSSCTIGRLSPFCCPHHWHVPAALASLAMKTVVGVQVEMLAMALELI